MSEVVMPKEYWLKEFLEKYSPKVFRPIAYYDSRRDAIVFQIRDCSIIEHELDVVFSDDVALIILLEDNYPEEGQQKYVGFVIGNIKSLFKNLGILFVEKLKLAEILHEIFKKDSDPIYEAALTQFIPFLRETELEVIFEES